MNGGAFASLDKGTSFSFAGPIHKLKLLLRVLRHRLTKIQPSWPSLAVLGQKSSRTSLSPPVFRPSLPQILLPFSLISAAADLASAFAKEGIVQ